MTIEEFRREIYKETKENLPKHNNKIQITEYLYNQTQKIVKYMEQMNVAAGIYEDSANKDEHSHFWEVLVGNTLLQSGLNIKRDTREAAPDYFFEIENGIKIHIEAKAPTEGTIKELKPKGIHIVNGNELEEESDFEDCIITSDKCALRFTSTLNETIKQINGFYNKQTVNIKDKIVIAINGSNVVKNQEVHEGDFSHGPMSYGFGIICALFGLDGQQYYLPNEKLFVYDEKCLIKNGIEIQNRYFCDGNNTPIDGIIYSNVNETDYITNDKPFIFIPNPSKDDISRYFPFCKNIGNPIDYV